MADDLPATTTGIICYLFAKYENLFGTTIWIYFTAALETLKTTTVSTKNNHLEKLGGRPTYPKSPSSVELFEEKLKASGDIEKPQYVPWIQRESMEIWDQLASGYD